MQAIPLWKKRDSGLQDFMERTGEMIKDEAEKILTRANMSLK